MKKLSNTVAKLKKTVAYIKGNAQFIFLCNPQKSSFNICLIKLLKKHCHKNSNCVFL